MNDNNPAWPTKTTDDLLWIMAKLRDPDGGCPWDVEQDFAAFTDHLRHPEGPMVSFRGLCK